MLARNIAYATLPSIPNELEWSILGVTNDSFAAVPIVNQVAGAKIPHDRFHQSNLIAAAQVGESDFVLGVRNNHPDWGCDFSGKEHIDPKVAETACTPHLLFLTKDATGFRQEEIDQRIFEMYPMPVSLSGKTRITAVVERENSLEITVKSDSGRIALTTQGKYRAVQNRRAVNGGSGVNPLWDYKRGLASINDEHLIIPAEGKYLVYSTAGQLLFTATLPEGYELFTTLEPTGRFFAIGTPDSAAGSADQEMRVFKTPTSSSIIYAEMIPLATSSNKGPLRDLLTLTAKGDMIALPSNQVEMLMEELRQEAKGQAVYAINWKD